MDYDSLDYSGESWERRYPDAIATDTEWVRNSSDAHWLPRTQIAPPPRVFISHRKSDRKLALDVAALAKAREFEVWLDVLDPYLSQIPPGTPPKETALKIAQTIEMGLLNCSHLVALITSESEGSAWIPYEYGRVKSREVMTENACALRGDGDFPFPEYLHLCPVYPTQHALGLWFALEAAKLAAVRLFGERQDRHP